MYQWLIRLLSLLLALLSPPAIVYAEEAAVQPWGDAPITLEAGLLANGSTLLSIPLDLGNKDIGAWLVGAGLSPKGIHGWDARLQKYVPLTTLRPGEGFLLARGPGKVMITGRRVAAATVDLLLNKGWNLIGVPYETGLPLGSLRVTLNGETESYSVAVDKHWVAGMTSLVDGRMAPLNGPSAHLEPWLGYWLYAYHPCHLTLPALQPEGQIQNQKGKIQKKP